MSGRKRFIMIELNSSLFQFRFQHHLNIIGSERFFDSGNGKTRLYLLLQSLLRDRDLKSNKNIIFIDSIESIRAMSFTENDCIIIDEFNYAPQYLDDLYQRLHSSNSNAILIGRLLVKQLMYSIDSIYSLEFVDNIPVLSKCFINSAGHEISTKIFTEDNIDVAKTYETVLGLPVTSCCGKDRFLKYIRNVKHPVIIADKPKIGPVILELIERSRHAQFEHLSCFLLQSFEEILTELEFTENFNSIATHAKLSFDAENYFEEYLEENSLLWDKDNVQESIEQFVSTYDFNSSSIVKLLTQFINGDTNVSEYTYEIPMSINTNLLGNTDQDNSERTDKIKAV